MTKIQTTSRIVVVTGASRGIGRACALKLANSETHLILIARSVENLEDTAMECQKLGAETTSLAMNLADMQEIKDKMESIISEVGKVDILINNAGIWLEQPFIEGDLMAWNTALDINLKSVINMTSHCAKVMPEGGAIISIASIASRKAYAGGTNYCAGKWGILGFSNSLFEDLKEKGIKVSSILPGLVNTDMHKGDSKLNEDKMIQPEDIAQTVEFILQMPARVCPTEITLWPQKNAKI